MTRLAACIGAHLEACTLASFWGSASILAAIAGRPALGAVGFATIAPVLAVYAIRTRSARRRS